MALKPVFSFLFLFAITCMAMAQKEPPLPADQIKISPLRVLDIVNPGYELSYERLYGRRYSTQLSLAYITNTVWDIDFENLKGFRAATEEKYFVKEKRKHRNYVASEIVWCRTRFNKEVSGLTQTDTAGFSEFTQTLPFRKQTLTLNIKYGWQLYLGQRLLLDISAGLGIRQYHVVQTTFPQGTVYEPVEKNFFPDIYDHASEPGRRISFTLPVNLKIGYAF